MKKITTQLFAFALIACCVLLLTFAGCAQSEEAADDAGDAMEEMVDEAEDAMDEGMDEVEEAMDEGEGAMDEALEEGEEMMEDMGEGEGDGQ